MKVLANLPPRSSQDLRTGSLRRGDLEGLEGLLSELDGARVVLVTGEQPVARDVATGLAAAAAAGGTRTALMECDLVEPGLADALGLSNAPGLHEYLRGTVEATEILKPVALAGPGSGAATEPLVCVVAGRPALEALPLVSSERFRHAVASLRDAYELLVLQGPPPGREAELGVAMENADATLAAVEGSGGSPRLPGEAAGLVVQG